jgi:hypothetical protein
VIVKDVEVSLLSIDAIRFYIGSIILALGYMHKRGIVYRCGEWYNFSSLPPLLILLLIRDFVTPLYIFLNVKTTEICNLKIFESMLEAIFDWPTWEMRRN